MKLIKKQMKGFFLFTAVLISIFFFSCSSGVVLDSRIDFDGQKWMRFEPDTASFEIKDTESVYDWYIQLRHTRDLQQDQIPVIVKIIGEEGELRSFLYNIQIKNKSGGLLGESIGDIYALEYKMKYHYSFNNPGKYQIIIQQVSSSYELSHILGIGLRLQKSKLDYQN